MIVVGMLTACGAEPTISPPPTPAALYVLATDMTEPLLLDLAEAYAAVNPNVAVVPVLVGAQGIEPALEAGEAGLALSVLADEGLFATPLGYARVVVVAHPDNDVGPLSGAQTRALFTGEIGDWA